MKQRTARRGPWKQDEIGLRARLVFTISIALRIREFRRPMKLPTPPFLEIRKVTGP